MENIIEKIHNYLLNNLLRISLFILLLLIYIGQFFIINYIIESKLTNKDIEEKTTNEIEQVKKDKEIEYIYVDLKGAISTPNVYKLLSGSRVIDAINEAGGLLKNANTRFINLSKELKDGDTIVVYTNEEIEEAKKQEIIYVETPCVCEEIKNDACYNEEKDTHGKININNANINELMTLSGIGESKAKAIIEFRNKNGLFSSIEEITKVSGISETLFNKIKENITV